MISVRRLASFVWIPVLLLALGLLGLHSRAALERADHLTALASEPPSVDATSKTGYAGGLRWWVVPGHRTGSYQWITQAQELLANGGWHLARINYDNAPIGREVTSLSPYRCWLAAVARGHRFLTGAPGGIAVERAARYADPLLLALCVTACTVLLAWRVGSVTAAVFAAAGTAASLASGWFVAGAPDATALTAAACALLAVAVVCAFWPRRERRAATRPTAGAVSPGGAPDRYAVPRLALAAVIVAAAAVFGLRSVPRGPLPEITQLPRDALEALLEREAAHWLARRAGEEGAIVLAPPRLSVSLFFHGGLQVLGTPYRDNEDGFRGAMRLASAPAADEAQALVRQRQLTHVLIPSWDGFLDDYARLGAAQPEGSLIGILHRWLPPRWLRPVPYYLPNLPELANDRLVVFEVTEVQEPAASLSRLADYFVDMAQPDLAGRAARALTVQFPQELTAAIARARAHALRREPALLQEALAQVGRELEEGTDELLAWDRRVNLCLLLADTGQDDLARVQADLLLAAMTERDLRSLPAPALFRFLTLCRALGLEPGDPAWMEKVRRWLPPQLRDRT